MVEVLQKIDTNHEELIHDAQANFYGDKLATASEDAKIKIFDLNGNQSKQIAELSGHEGPVWQLDWSHPEFGNLLASCSYDRRLIIWKERDGNWEKIKEYKDHSASVNSVQWAPREFGPMLACASSDGSISILKRTADEDWEVKRIQRAHIPSVNVVSWAPPINSVSTIYRGTASTSGSQAPGDNNTVLNRPKPIMRFVSGGCDNLLRIWKFVEQTDQWVEERQLDGHTDSVRDVAWAPSIGLPKWQIASGSLDKKVIIWTNHEGPNGQEWESKALNFNDFVWHVSWSVMGNTLAVSCGEKDVSLWKEDMTGDFKKISDVET